MSNLASKVIYPTTWDTGPHGSGETLSGYPEASLPVEAVIDRIKTCRQMWGEYAAEKVEEELRAITRAGLEEQEGS